MVPRLNGLPSVGWMLIYGLSKSGGGMRGSTNGRKMISKSGTVGSSSSRSCSSCCSRRPAGLGCPVAEISPAASFALSDEMMDVALGEIFCRGMNDTLATVSCRGESRPLLIMHQPSSE